MNEKLFIRAMDLQTEVLAKQIGFAGKIAAAFRRNAISLAR